MSLLDKIFGESYGIKIIRRQVRNGRQDNVIEDRAAVVEDDDTKEKQLKLKSDGKKIPKPSNLYFDRIQGSGLLSTSSDFIEIEEDGDDVSFVDFQVSSNDDEDGGSLNPERSEKEHIFQAHRDFMNKKTLEVWNSASNQEIYILATILMIVVIQLAGQYFIVNGLQSGIVEGVANALSSADIAANAAN